MGKYREHIAKTISKYRKALGIKQTELAKQLNVAPSSISAWENNLNAPDIEILAELCDIFNISMDEMYGVDINISTDSINAEELQHIKKYRFIDLFSKEVIDSVLNIEYRRCLENSTSNQIKEDIVDSDDEYITEVAARGNSELQVNISKDTIRKDLENYTPPEEL